MRSLTQRLFSKMVSIRVGQENIENIKKFNEFILKYSVPAIGVGIDPTVILDRFPDLCDSGQALNYIIQVFAENLIETLDTDDIKNKIKTKTQQNAKLLLNLAIKSSDNSAKQTDPSVEIQNLFNEFISSCHPYFVAQSPTPDIERAKKVFIVLWTNIQNLPELASTDMSICFNIAWINYSASRNSQYTNIGFTKH